MESPYDVIICTNIYNRTHTITTYIESLLQNTNKNTKYHIYFIANYDELFQKTKALDDINFALNQIDWKKFGLTSLEAKQFYDVLPIPNLSLSGYNLGLEIGKTLNYTPVILCNDDLIWAKNWEELLKLPTKVIREGKEYNIRPESIGAVAGDYIVAGSMKHQEHQNNRNHWEQYDFVVGHFTLITSEALKRGFNFKSEWCELFGCYDVYLSMTMCLLELNTVVNHSIIFDFPNSAENHFHCGDQSKFTAKLKPHWDKMTKRLHEEYQPIHKKKWNGENKWYFE